MSEPMTRREAEAQEGISDLQQDIEFEAMRRFFGALREMDAVLPIINGFSSLVSIDVAAWDAFKSDELPTREEWDRKIAAARNP